jgi:glycosyltransferase involved in cell wall biosynthesis
VAGDSGGAAEAVVDGETGFVVADPSDPAAVAEGIGRLLADPERAARMGRAGRARAVAEFSYDGLAARLGAALAAWEAGAGG